jgi:hypothetical protein
VCLGVAALLGFDWFRTALVHGRLALTVAEAEALQNFGAGHLGLILTAHCNLNYTRLCDVSYDIIAMQA